MIQKLMLYGIPASLLISGGIFPIGVVIYWVTTNLFSLGQQFWVLRKYPPPPSAKTAAAKAAGGRTSLTKGGRDGGRDGGKGGKVTDAKGGKGGRVDGKADGAGSAPDGRSLAPRPGAKPVRNKKGGPARRTSG
jgi:YidC/Oxa1 family membrane protein insertase